VDELEAADARLRVLLDDVRPDDVGGHEVGGELNAAEGQLQDISEGPHREGPHHQGLGEARDADHQAVALAEERDEQLVHHVPLPDDDLGHLAGQQLAPASQRLERRPFRIAGVDGRAHGNPPIRECLRHYSAPDPPPATAEKRADSFLHAFTDPPHRPFLHGAEAAAMLSGDEPVETAEGSAP